MCASFCVKMMCVLGVSKTFSMDAIVFVTITTFQKYKPKKKLKILADFADIYFLKIFELCVNRIGVK